MQYIDRELRSHRFPNCAQIAECFDVSRRSIQRDIDFMRDRLGAPIDFDRRRNGYRYTQDWMFDTSAIAIRQQTNSQTETTVRHRFDVPRDSLHTHTRNSLPHNAPVPLFDIPSLDRLDAGDFDKGTLKLLEQAIVQRRKLRITYLTSSDLSTSERTIRPYRLHFDHSSETWYLIAYCEHRQDIKAFAVRRIHTPVLTPEPFMLPSLFSILGYIDRVFHRHHTSFPVDISIRFTPYQSRWIRLRQWHSSQQIEEHEDGSLTLRITIGTLNAVKRWVMHFGAQAEVLQPEKLRAMIRDEVAVMGQVYETDAKERRTDV